MKYSETSGEITVTVEEMVSFSLFHYLGTAAGEELLPVRRADGATRRRLGFPEEALPLEKRFVSGGHSFCLLATADSLVQEGRRRTLSLAFLTGDDPAALGTGTVRAARGEGFLLAAAITPSPTALSITYYNETLDTHTVVTETLSGRKLSAFFERAAASLSLYAASEITRVTKRLPAMRRLRFPYPETRLGQEELMGEVYRAVKRGRRLYASAPTGIGKTVSTLYPAVRAMGEGGCDKIFYLTAKATAARMAGETAALLGRDGALRAVLLASKERLCPQRGVPCREGIPCPRRRAGGVAEDRATAALLALEKPLMTPEEIARVAATHGVCAHELSLRYSMLSDVVICDYNYLFDPAIRLARYFALGGRYCFLIDEAHNLGDRIRDTYTVTLTAGMLSSLPLPEGGGELCCEVRERRDALLSLLESELSPLAAEAAKEGKSQGETLRTLPAWLVPSIGALLVPLGKLMRQSSPERDPALRKHIRAFYYEMKSILDILSAYDEGFRLLVFRGEEGIGLRTLCLDPAGVIAHSLGDGRSAVLFSATLRPIDFYRDTLGGEGNDVTLELPSPFERDNLAVAVMDKISTRYTDREETLTRVCHAVRTTVLAQPGNYMVFCPSFAYAERLATAFRAAAPGMRTLLQGRSMTPAERAAFLGEFETTDAPLVAFCVLGGIFGEGIDLLGRRLLGTVIVGVGLGTPDPYRDEIARYFRDKCERGVEYAYVYPGMNRVLQAAGRVIRDEGDVGVVVLIDDRFASPVYRETLPEHWHGLSYVGDERSLAEYLRRFWSRHQEETP